MYARLTTIPNRPLLYDLYQYSWDAKETTMLLDSYVAWLGEHLVCVCVVWCVCVCVWCVCVCVWCTAF